MNSTLKLAENKHKKTAIAMAAAGVALAVAEATTQATVIPRLGLGFHVLICLFITFTGLLSLALCKEKVEDERVKAIRSKAMMKGFVFTCAVTIAFPINIALFPFIAPEAFEGITITRDDYAYVGMFLMAFPAFATISYLALFNYGLRYDEGWDFNDEMTPVQSFKKNKKYVIIFQLVMLALLAAMIIWGRMSK
ncbi:MAG: hypothetical protein KF744_02020 [Taibaiella sp.]|nr:hypothetical protein [Taibaiella sp.]